MKRVAFLLLFIAGWAVPGAFAQENEHVQVGVFADYFRLSQTDTDLLGVGGRASFVGYKRLKSLKPRCLTTSAEPSPKVSPTIPPAR